MSAPKTALSVLVMDATTHQDVHCVEVYGATEGTVERVLRGMLINLDHERFYLAVVKRSA